jgi:U3 small nucleolar RNA-associated protein 20
MEAAAELTQISHTLPQLIHHKQDILDSLLPRLTIQASLSLEPIFDLIAALSRDLQDEFLPHVDEVITAMSDLVESGLDREPELLQYVFSCLSQLCKNLTKQLTTDLLMLLKQTSRLRHHTAPHVRALSAQSIGFIIRQAPSAMSRAAIKATAAEAVTKPSPERIQAAGLLIAEAAIGIGNGLHSKANSLLTPLFKANAMKPGDFKAGKLSSNDINARTTAVASACLARLLEHLRRGKTIELWTLLFEEYNRRRQESNKNEEDGGECSKARALALLIQMMEYRRGARVEDFGPLFELSKQLVTDITNNSSTTNTNNDAEDHLSPDDVNTTTTGTFICLENGSAMTPTDMLHPSLSTQTLRYLLAMIKSHSKEVGASKGPAALEPLAPLWATLLSRVPFRDAVIFGRAVISRPCGYDVARFFGPQLLGCVGSRLLLVSSSLSPDVEKKRKKGGGSSKKKSSDDDGGIVSSSSAAGGGGGEEVCWPLLIDLCATLSVSSNVSILLSASGCGLALAKFIQSCLTASTSSRAVQWAALQCLPQASESLSHALQCCLSFISSFDTYFKNGNVKDEDLSVYCAAVSLAFELATSALSFLEEEEEEEEEDDDEEDERGGSTTTMDSKQQQAKMRQVLAGVAMDVLGLLLTNPADYQVLTISAGVLEAAVQLGLSISLKLMQGSGDDDDDEKKKKKKKSNESKQQKETLSLEAFIQVLAPNTSQTNAIIRQSTLKCIIALIALYNKDTNQRDTDGDDDQQQHEQQSSVSKDVFDHLLGVETRELGPDSSRYVAVALGRIKSLFEYGRVAGVLVPAVVHGLLGTLYIKFSSVWQPAAEAIASAIDSHTGVTWPIVFEHLDFAQNQLLGVDYKIYHKDDDEDRGGEEEEEQAVARQDNMRLLSKRFNHATHAENALHTDVSITVMYCLRSMAAANNNTIESKSKVWVPLFLQLVSVIRGGGNEKGEVVIEDDDDDEEEEEDDKKGHSRNKSNKGESYTASGSIVNKEWKNALKEWLGVLGKLKGARGLYKSDTVSCAVAAQLLDMDTTVQTSALHCLAAFKLPFLMPYSDRLLKLADNKTLRAELAAFPLSPDSKAVLRDGEEGAALLEEHRQGLVPLLTRLLYPKMRKRNGRLGGKGAPGSARAAILNFLSAAKSGELQSLLQLFLEPLADKAFIKPPSSIGNSDNNTSLPRVLGEVPWWSDLLGTAPGSTWLKIINGDILNKQPIRRRIGYLNTLEDLLKHLGHRLGEYLPVLIVITLSLLQGTTASLSFRPATNGDDPMQSEDDDEDTVDQIKEVRSRCLRLLAAIMERFPNSTEYVFMWNPLFIAIAPLVERIPVESSADRAPALIDFAAALAAEEHLAPVLQQHQELVKSSIAALGAVTCSEPSRSAILGLIENIFELPGQLSAELLEPHMSQLLTSLQHVVTYSAADSSSNKQQQQLHQQPSMNKQKQRQKSSAKKATAYRALALLEVVASQVTDQSAALQLTEALLPLLQASDGAKRNGGRKGGGNSAEEQLIARTLAALTALWNRLLLNSTITAGSDNSNQDQATAIVMEKVANALAPLFGWLEGLETRAALCVAYEAVANLLSAGTTTTLTSNSKQQHQSMREAAAVLTGLNAVSKKAIDEPDYDARIKCHTKLKPDYWAQVPPIVLPALLQHCLKELRNGDDLALRHAGSQALFHFIQSVASIGNNGGDDGDVMQQDAATEQPPPAVLVAQKVLFPQLKRGIASHNIAVRQEHLSLLREAIKKLPTLHADLSPLTDDDVEVDILLNAAHIQMHRRSRALIRLSRLVAALDVDGEKNSHGTTASGTGGLSLGALMSVVLPLLQVIIVESKDSSGGGEVSVHESNQDKDRDREASVVDAAVYALGAVARVLPWVQYQQILGQYLRAMKRLGAKNSTSGTNSGVGNSKAVIRSVCVILEAFHYDIEDAETQAFLLKRVIPELRDQIVSNDDDNAVARAPVALGIVKVLKLLPDEVMRLELPRTLQKVGNLLKKRLQSTRDSARTVLVSVTTQLGPDYYPFLVEILVSACPAKGFTAHVLGYTLHATLAGLVKNMTMNQISKNSIGGDDGINTTTEVVQWSPGALDDSLGLLLPLMEADVFGDIADAKEVSAFAANYKETKKCKAYETYELLASCINFEKSASMLLEPVRRHMADASSPKVKSKLSQLLQAAVKGLLVNPTVTAADLCMFFYATTSAGLTAEEATRAATNACAQAATAAGDDIHGDAPIYSVHGGKKHLRQQQQQEEERVQQERAALHQPLLVEFSLTLLQGGMKKGIIPLKSTSSQLLDPLLPLLIRALQSRHSPNVSSSLHSLTTLLTQMPPGSLPALLTAAPEAGKVVTGLLKRCPSTSHPIAQDCFRLLAGMLRRCQGYEPPPSQLRFLLGWAFADLEESCSNANGVAAFDLLKAILSRKMVLPEVYDLMIRVQELMVRSQGSNVRTLCSSAMLLFLLDYPLGDKRLQSHLQFLLTNLSYQHESGREAVLDMLEVMIRKFPSQLIGSWADTVALPLIIRLVNDPSSKCRVKVGAALGMLFGRLSVASRDKLVAYCQKWMTVNNNGQQDDDDGRLKRAAAQALGILAQQEKGTFSKRIPNLLPLMTNILKVSGGTSSSHIDDNEDERGISWEAVYYCLVLLQKMTTLDPAIKTTILSWSNAKDMWSTIPPLLVHNHAWVRGAAGRVIGAALAEEEAIGGPMLKSGVEGTGAGQLALAFYRQFDSDAADEGLAGQAVKCMVFLAPFMMNESDKKSATKNAQNGDDEEDDGDEENEKNNNNDSQSASSWSSLHGLCKRMARLADDRNYARQMQRALALRFIAALSSRLQQGLVSPYLPTLLKPLYRLSEPGGNVSSSADIVTLGEEVMSHLRSVVDGDLLLQAFNIAREGVVQGRVERKRKAAVQSMVDPEAAAKRRMRKQERKGVGKKRKLEAVKRMRSAGVAVKNKKSKR